MPTFANIYNLRMTTKEKAFEVARTEGPVNCDNCSRIPANAQNLIGLIFRDDAFCIHLCDECRGIFANALKEG